MPLELGEFAQDFFQEVLRTADADGIYTEDAFFDLCCKDIEDAGDLETADRSHYAARGMRIDGYGGDPISMDGTLNLIVADFSPSSDVETLTATKMDESFKRLTSFLEKSLHPEFRDTLDDSSPGFGIADLISKRWPTVSKIRLFLISNRVLSARVDGRPGEEFYGVPVTYNVWDLGRLHRYAEAGNEREDIEVDLENEFGGPLLALPAYSDGTAGYESYLTVIPGSQLAAIYDRWGVRLLEQNVRVFLQARGNVNKGIRNTLENEPSMFFAYNNGMSATAEAVETATSPRGLSLMRLKNLQIVNGGQTTASIHTASRKKDVDLSKVFVQVKLTVIPPASAMEIVPKISQFANTQNAVNAADFFANHPFHVRMEEFSRRLFAPSPDGTFRESKWFYERARGQYLDAMASLTPKQKANFQNEYPKRQMFSKTDLAKFLNPWRGQPHIVSRGAQKNFADFAEFISKAWSQQSDAFNETYFRHAIAKAIVFREGERLVTEQPWYQGGYRANIVVYAIAKLANDVDGMDRALDLDAIWKSQHTSDCLSEALTIAAEAVNKVIIDTDGNVTEWAKQQACWYRVERLNLAWPDCLHNELITREELQEKSKSAKKDQKVLNGIAAQSVVVTAGSTLWRDVKNWGLSKGHLSQTDAEILEVAASMEKRLPSEKQSIRVVETLTRLHSEGCQIGIDLV